MTMYSRERMDPCYLGPGLDPSQRSLYPPLRSLPGYEAERFPPREAGFPAQVDFTPLQPGFTAPRQQEFTPRAPEFSPRNPDFSPREAEFASAREAEFSPRGAEFSPRDTGYSPCKPEFSPREPEFSPPEAKFSPDRTEDTIQGGRNQFFIYRVFLIFDILKNFSIDSLSMVDKVVFPENFNIEQIHLFQTSE